MSESSSLPLFSPAVDPGPSFADVLRQARAAPASRARASTAPSTLDIPHGTTVVAIRFAGGVIMAGDRRATAGYMIASRRIEKVFPADDFSGVAIAGAAGPAVEMVKLFQVQLEHYEKVQGDDAEPRGQGQPARPARARRTCPPRCRASWSSRCSRATTPRATAAASSATTSPAAATRSSTSRRRARAASTPATGSRRAGAKASTADETIGLAITSLFAAADEDVATGGPDLVRRIFPTVAVIDADGYRALTDDDVEARSQIPPPGRRAGRRRNHEHAVLRLAGTGDEGPRRLRAQGHRPGPQPRRARVPGRRPHRRRQPVAHALQDQRDLRPHRVRRGRQVQRVPDAAGRGRAPRRHEGLLVLARRRRARRSSPTRTRRRSARSSRTR